MAHINKLEYKSISNTGISSRVRQVLVLLAVILIGMLISASVNAIPSKMPATNKQVNNVDYNLSRR